MLGGEKKGASKATAVVLWDEARMAMCQFVTSDSLATAFSPLVLIQLIDRNRDLLTKTTPELSGGEPITGSESGMHPGRVISPLHTHTLTLTHSQLKAEVGGDWGKPRRGRERARAEHRTFLLSQCDAFSNACQSRWREALNDWDSAAAPDLCV